jgi:hypothetical protein
MRRFLRLLTLWLFALALPVQGALAATGMASHAGAPSHTMSMPDGTTMDAGAMPCHAHAVDKAGCGTCCGPIFTQQALLTVAPVATRWAPLPRVAADAAPPLFLTGGTDRPPRLLLA